jgi:hypothetical protein
MSYFGKYRGRSAGKWWSWAFDTPVLGALIAWVRRRRRR